MFKGLSVIFQFEVFYGIIIRYFFTSMDKEELQKSIQKKESQIRLLNLVSKGVRKIQEKKDRSKDCASLSALDEEIKNL
jgi:hypothetical protein